jgi:hypothetical protein
MIRSRIVSVASSGRHTEPLRTPCIDLHYLRSSCFQNVNAERRDDMSQVLGRAGEGLMPLRFIPHRDSERMV